MQNMAKIVGNVANMTFEGSFRGDLGGNWNAPAAGVERYLILKPMNQSKSSSKNIPKNMTSCPSARVLKWALQGKSQGIPVTPLVRCATMTGPQRAREVRSMGAAGCNPTRRTLPRPCEHRCAYTNHFPG